MGSIAPVVSPAVATLAPAVTMATQDGNQKGTTECGFLYEPLAPFKSV
jgi:hypothetical protein